MFPMMKFLITLFMSFISALFLVYPIKKLAIRLNILDIPNNRKIHTKPIPRAGGLAIVFGTLIGLAYFQPAHEHFLEYIVGVVIITMIGLLDDKFSLHPLLKLIGQLVTAIIIIHAGVTIERITLPFIGIIDFSQLVSVVITLIWIIGITNAINLIDGLDGLASGVSTIALLSIFTMSIMDERFFVASLCISLIGSSCGFLFHNFYPAKIYMGDTGSLFLGFSISFISILGLFKKITIFSFIIPIIVLAVPIFDTLFAITRRLLNGEKIMKPDKKHIHHQLLAAGFSHRTTVLIIYGMSAVFGLLAIIFSSASISQLLFVSFIWIILIYVLAEFVGLFGRKQKPILNLFKWLFRLKN